MANFLPLPKTLKPVTSFCLAFLLGPFALISLYVFWISKGLPGAEQRGLFQFYSATLGDFIVLPFTWYLISKYFQKISHYNVKLMNSQRIIFFSYFVGLATSLGVTFSGVYGNNRDWTLPELGKINFAGIYHSVFMAIMLGTYWNFFLNHWFTINENIKKATVDRNTLSELTKIYWSIINLLSLFNILLWADNTYGLEKSWKTFFFSNNTHQILWGAFLFVNAVFTIQNKLVLNIVRWIGKELIAISILLVVGVILSNQG